MIRYRRPMTAYRGLGGQSKRERNPVEKLQQELDTAWLRFYRVKALYREGTVTKVELLKELENLNRVHKKIGSKMCVSDECLLAL